MSELAYRVQVAVAQAMNDRRLTVVPVLCFANQKVEGGDRVGGVLVTSESSIAKRITGEKAVLSPEDVQALAMLLDHALPPFERRTS